MSDTSMDLPHRQGGTSTWRLILGWLLTLAISAFGLGLIWDRVPQFRLLEWIQPNAQERARQQARTEWAAEAMDAELREGLRCAGDIAARLQLAPGLTAAASPGAGSGSETSQPLCKVIPKSLSQVWVVDAARPDLQTARKLHGPDVTAVAQPLGSKARMQVDAAVRTQWDTYALSQGDPAGIDQFVPVRSTQPEQVVLMRYRLAAGPEMPRLIDDASADQGVPIGRARGLRLAVDDTESKRRWMITVSWVLLSLLIMGLIWGRFRARGHRAALRLQVEAAQIAQHRAEASAQAARVALTLADQAHAEAVAALQVAEQAKAQLAEEVRIREDIEDSSPVGLRVIDNEGRLLRVSRAFCATSGWTREQLIDSKPPYPFWPAAEGDNHNIQLQDVFGPHLGPEGLRVEFARPDGTRWLAHVRATRMRNKRQWLLSSVDITADRDRQQRFEKLEEEMLRQANFFLLGEQALQLAHDLSSHVLAIEQSVVNVLAGLAQQREGRSALDLQNIENQTALMKRQLGDFARQIRGELHCEDFHIHEVVEGAMLLEAEHARAMNARVFSNVSVDMPKQSLPKLQLMHVVRNLISNGLKAMSNTDPVNRLIVIGSVVESDPPSETHPHGRHWLHLTVGDHGHGLTAVDTLFDEPRAGSASGYGLGLWICRRWIERMGGRISVQHTSRRGTVMLIVLPYVPEPDHD